MEQTKERLIILYPFRIQPQRNRLDVYASYQKLEVIRLEDGIKRWPDINKRG